MDAAIAGQVLAEFRRLSQLAPRLEMAQTEILEQLTKAEMAVLQRVAQGQDNQQISAELNLSVKTITNRLSSIYQKLQVNNRVQVTLYALRQGWVGLDSAAEN